MTMRPRLVALAAAAIVIGAGLAVVQPWKALVASGVVTVGSTTTTQYTGFLDYLQDTYRRQTGVPLKIVVGGTGGILQQGRNGDLDVLLTHDRERELKFVADGEGLWRKPVMYNQFIVVGPRMPTAAPPWTQDQLAANATAFFIVLYRQRDAITFVSRGDGSGTNARELALWKSAGINDSDLARPWYKETGAGQADTLRVAAQLGAYTLCDEATWNLLKNRGLTGTLSVMVRDPGRLRNQYGVVPVSQVKHPNANQAGGIAFARWLTGPEGQAAIAAFNVAGMAAFYPDAGDPNG